MILALAGPAGCGKDTVAKMLLKAVPGSTSLALADPLKKICKDVFDFSDEQLYGPSEERNKPDKRYLQCTSHQSHHSDECFLTPRYALQRLGTEWGRNCYPDIWVDVAVRRATKLLAAVREVTVDCPSCGRPETKKERICPLVVITDCRFLNEAQRVRSLGGVVWSIRRDSSLIGAAADHASEKDFYGEEFQKLVTVHIQNDGSIYDLERRVQLEVTQLPKETP